MSGNKPTWQLEQELAAMTQERDALALHLDAIGQSLGLSGFESRPLACYVDDLNQQLAALTLTWTDTKPTKPGWYWWKAGSYVRDPSCMYIERIVSHRGKLVGAYSMETLDDMGGQWAGPIHTPKEG